MRLVGASRGELPKERIDMRVVGEPLGRAPAAARSILGELSW